jgi:serine protease AprX
VKVSNALGGTDVDRIISAIRWVTQHAHDGGRNIRVLNLSFGATATGSYKKDDLAYAVEQAWKAGIVTVVAAGNSGVASGGLDDPAFDPYIVAVGADNTHGTTDVADDTVAAFSSRGDGSRDPDVVAPGKSVVSLRVPGSFIDNQHPEARVGDVYFRGSGTSQAAAVVSGAAALVLSQRPQMRVGQVKALLMQTARSLTDATYSAQGRGLIDLAAALNAPTPDTKQTWPSSTGSTGAWWSVAEATGNSWSSTGNSWSGNSWTGDGWSGPGWDEDNLIAGNSWSAGGWEGVSWGRKPKDDRVTGPGAGRGKP